MKNMRIIDSLSKYGIDKIGCYERPIANILNSYSTGSGDGYILLSKISEFFNIFPNFKETMIKLYDDYFGVEIKYICANSKSIKKALDNNMLVVASCDLKEIFYSKYYKEQSWPHYYLIIGYDERKDTYKVFDNEHFDIIGRECGNFTITFEMMKKAMKEYKKNFDDSKTVIAFRKNNQFNYNTMILFILEKYLEINVKDKDVYKYSLLLNNLSEMSNGSFNSELIEEYKKKIVNIQKSKIVILDKIQESMIYVGYDKNVINELETLKKEYERVMNVFVLTKLIEFQKGKLVDCKITDEMIEKEELLKKYVEDYVKYLKLFKENKELKEGCVEEGYSNKYVECNNEKYEFINNQDNVIRNENDIYIFEFCKNNRYQWAEEDLAPKVMILKESIIDKTITLKLHLLIENNLGNTNYMAGFYVRNANEQYLVDKGYFATINKENLMLLGELGEYKSDTYTDNSCDYTREANLFVKIEGHRIIYGEIIGEELVDRLSCSYANVGVTEIGFACITWDDAKGLKVVFDNIEVDYE